MLPLNTLKRYWIAYLFVLVISLAGCYTNNGKCPGCDATAFAPDVDLKIVDAKTRQDLFFGTNAKYNINLLRIKHVEKGVLDSVLAPFAVDSVNHSINVKMLYRNPADTIAVIIGTSKPQKLVLYTNTLNSCCARIVITMAKYNDSLILKAPADPLKWVNIRNKVTIPIN